MLFFGIIIALITAVGISIYYDKKNYEGGDCIIGVTLLSFVLAACAIGVICGCAYDYPASIKDIETYSNEICSLKRESGINGGFFLGTGSINNETYYVTYVKDMTGGKEGYVLRTIPTKIAKIIETNEKKPSQVWYLQKLDLKDWLVPWNTERNTYDTYREIYVPKGTIISEFKLQ